MPINRFVRAARRALSEQRRFGQFGPASPCRQLDPATLAVISEAPAIVPTDPHQTIRSAVSARKQRIADIRQRAQTRLAAEAERRSRKWRDRGDD